MSQADVLQEAQDWLLEAGDPSYLSMAYADALESLAHETLAFVDVRVIPGEADVATYTAPPETIELFAIAYYPVQMEEAPLYTLDAADRGWREWQDTPAYWQRDSAAANSFQVAPAPVVDGIDGGFGVVEQQPPIDSFAVILAQIPPETDLFQWMEGLLVYRVVAADADRLGETRAPELAKLMTTMSPALEGLLFGASLRQETAAG